MELIYQLTNNIHYLSFFLIISIIVFVHEYGHYIVAKICKVKVESFSIGFGPELFGFNDKSGTRWKLSAIPLGGYVKMLGDTNEASIPDKKQELTDEEKLLSFHEKPRYKKAAIVFAGPFANIIFTVIVLTVFFCIEGYYRIPPVIGNVIKGSVAEVAGLLPGDVITQVNNNKIRYFEDITHIVISNPRTKMQIEYKRSNKKHVTALIPSIIEDKDAFGNLIKKESIGITSINVTGLKQTSFFGAVNLSINETYRTMTLAVRAMGQIVIGKRDINQISGPIKIAQYSSQSFKKGITTFLYFMAIISANLAAINLLPVPLLDGGHLFHYTIEALTRRNLTIKYQKYAAIIGAVILFSLMAIAILNDIRNVILT
ncbi:RIP metalloprotease RseP [Wolbachia endosymbiont of Chironomus riparius]|uniref:RIP metalloprotease RseP n=1 Tax=Wolbachia endosymbiont of Chironomus riparius TaxID=2883238 RepID=UPI00209FC7D3|nr:RIP metalloprotease RseP [Wolbachia endosymbiont of Chironomus riparius]